MKRNPIKLLFIIASIAVVIFFFPTISFADQLTGSNTTDIVIPDADIFFGALSGIYISGAPGGSVVTSVEYRVRVVNVWVSDIKMMIESPDGSQELIWPQGTGGSTDQGYDDDAADDNDIYLNWRVAGSSFDGESPNGWWYLHAWDMVPGDEGYIDYFEIRVNYTPPSTSPDLVPYQPPGYSDEIVISHSSGTNSDETIYANQTVYIDYAVLNDGDGEASGGFYVEIRDDTTSEIIRRGFYSGSLQANYYYRQEDSHWTFTQTGWHTIRLKIDADNNISESNEANNEYTKQIYVSQSPQFITVTSPNGGEVWGLGSTHNITWTSSGLSGDVTIDLYRVDTNYGTIGTASAVSGTYSWYISPTLPTGNNYRVKIYSGSVLDYSDGNFSLATKPTVTTNAVSSITSTSSVCGGIVTSDGGAAVTARGVCWSTSANPTIINSKTSDGSGTGGFTSNMTGLNSETTYYVRAYATNSLGTSYGEERNFTTEPSITPHTLNVKSTPGAGVDITVTPNDNDGKGNGTTDFTRTYDPGTEVTLTAPAINNGKNFQKWLVDNADRTGRTITVTMDSDHTAQAVYQASTYTLTVQSSPDSDVPITVNPNDNNGQGSGNTQLFRTYNYGTIANLTAPASHNGKNFVKWLINGVEDTNRTIQVTMNKNHTAQAVFQSPTYTLTVQSSPYIGVGITVSPTDNNGNGDGNTNFTRNYDSGKAVSLTAPSSFSGADFIKWAVDGKEYSNRTIQLTMESNHTAVVYYETSSPPEISVNRTSLNFGYIIGSSNIPKESFTIYNNGGGTLSWTASCELWRVTLSPESGTNCGVVEVIFDLHGLPPQKSKKDVIYVSDPLVANSPVEIRLNLWVKTQSESSAPFGAFSTPLDGSTVRSSIAVTGWALGDTGIESIKIYRESGKNLVYIGDALLVEGARPDVEASYPDYPMNYKAGWGYMMLTNFLPNGGNGIYKIHAIATDKEGRTKTLGTKTITVDNANAVKPFGAIDTPTQGGIASGNNFVNWGWVLTPQPNSIPTDGFTIEVFVNGVKRGNPTYNVYRSDIASLFPGYANSDGAIGYFHLDTTAYEDGIHSIYWTAEDNAGNSDGIGSRYFTIRNTCAASGQTSRTAWSKGQDTDGLDISSIRPINTSISPVHIKKGYNRNSEPEILYPDEEGIINIEIRELQRLEINLEGIASVKERENGNANWIGFFLSCDRLKPLPVGSTLDKARGIFYWHPGPGFYGNYEFVFLKEEPGRKEKVNLKIKILPKFTRERE